MASNDDSQGADDSTKQVDRSALAQALNKSVDSGQVLKRMNAQVAAEVHAEGTAKVDRDAVRNYLEAARSGEMPIPSSDYAAAADSEAEFSVDPVDPAVFKSDARDKTGPKAAIFHRNSSRTDVKVAEAPSDEVAAAIEASVVIEADLAVDEKVVLMGEEPTYVEDEVAPAQSESAVQRGSKEAEEPLDTSFRSFRWILALAVGGGFLGIILAVVWVLFQQG